MKRKPYPPQLQTAALLSVTAALVCLSTTCNPALQCGTWTFSGTPVSVTAAQCSDKFPPDSLSNVVSAFTFNPATCGKSCTCDQDVMIQMTWVYDATTRTNLYAASGDEDRADADGWNIDRVNGAAYGYYGLLNDGKTFYSFWNTPGANGTANTLFDGPGGWPCNSYFYAVDAATCFTSRTCQNNILGYYFWSWTIDSSGKASEFIISPAWSTLETEFQSALAAWNTWAPTSGPEADPTDSGQPTLPNAVKFPAMSDL